MARRNPLAAFRDPARRPRAIIWTLVTVIALAAVVVVMLTATSTRWFCNEVCHAVHDDNAAQYAASSHSEISCIACHIPVELGAVKFALEKADKMRDVYATLTGTFEMPLNHGSHIALSMTTDYCTQCHALDTREVSPSKGLIMNHEKHDEVQPELNCTVCHNRVAHSLEPTPTLPGNKRPEDFMSMTACFRCHTLTEASPSAYKAPGACDKCHKKGYPLKPKSHETTSFYNDRGVSTGHAEMAREEASQTAEAQAEWAEFEPEFKAKEPSLVIQMLNIPEGELIDVPPVETVNECFTCHVEKTFCNGCHGVQMPHTAEFKKGHSKTPTAQRDDCGLCHNKTGDKANDANSCTGCHHKMGDQAKPWFPQHPGIVKKTGGEECLQCHEEAFCSGCHVQGTKTSEY